MKEVKEIIKGMYHDYTDPAVIISEQFNVTKEEVDNYPLTGQFVDFLDEYEHVDPRCRKRRTMAYRHFANSLFRFEIPDCWHKTMEHEGVACDNCLRVEYDDDEED